MAGASGYAGGELLRLLLGHPEVEIGALTAGGSAGTRLGVHQPHLVPLADRVLAETTPETLAGHDVVFLALPHGQSAELAAQLGDDTSSIDCGADHRLTDPAPGTASTAARTPARWPYGMPELPGARDALRGTHRIAVPGCYPTAATLALSPALAAGLVEPDVVVVAAVRHLRRRQGAQAAPARLRGDGRPVGVRRRRRAPAHAGDRPEPLGAAGGPVAVSFTPVLAPMPRGILATCTARAPDATTAAVREAYEKAYADEPFVHLLPEGSGRTTAATLGANTVQLQVAVDPTPAGSSSSPRSTTSPRARPAAPCSA